eukprot:TRINITY_DN16083_c0_g1_i1.p1 TRINITY_DN16083_c0_g1~~TRINITY_DN16083_c0_g1_i1.p1  ORF type:complete len:650 (+),score=223.18 TRINITY_DN16083_c0_g1_i1:60-2009(+)
MGQSQPPCGCNLVVCNEKKALNGGSDVPEIGNHSDPPIKASTEAKLDELEGSLSPPGDDEFLQCVLDGEAAKVETMLRRGADKDARDDEGRGCVHMAVEYNRLEVLDLLLEYKCDVNMLDKLKNAPLHLAASCNRPDAARLLLAKKCKKEVANKEHVTPLLLAGDRGSIDVAHELIAAGACRNDLNKEFLEACTRNDVMMANTLLDCGASADVKSEGSSLSRIITKREDRWTPLFHAAEHGHLGIMKLILDKTPAGVNPKCQEGRTPIFAAVAAQQYEAAQLLLDRGADREVCDVWGNTPLLIAVDAGDADLVALMMERRAEATADEKEALGCRLVAAAERGDTESCKVLLNVGANVDCKEEGRTALMVAAETGNVKVLHLLLEKGASRLEKTEDGKTALVLAAESGSAEVWAALMLQGVSKPERLLLGKKLLQATAKGDTKTIKAMLACKASLEVKATDGRTALAVAVEHNNTEHVKLLLAKGAKPNVKSRKGKSVLYYAFKKDNLGMVAILNSKGAVVQPDEQADFHTFLMELVQRKCEEKHQESQKDEIELLLACGMDPNMMVPETKLTALHVACDRNSLDIVRVLIEGKANVSQRAGEGNKTPLYVASTMRHTAIAKLLVESGANSDGKDTEGQALFDKLTGKAS